MKLLLISLFVIIVYIAILKITAPYREKKRIKKCEELLQIIRDMLNKSKYEEILDRIKKEKVLTYQCRLPPDLRRKITEIEIECLEKLNKIKEAVISLSSHLASTYESNEWPKDLYEKWLSLYKSIEPLPVKEFYFCECCGLHPDEKALLDSAIEKGCRAPIDYPGECKSAIVMHFGPRKAKKKE